jgi:hypothetical protein
MPIFLIMACEMATFSFLIGAFMKSLILGLVVFAASGFSVYFLFQEFYNPRILVWGVTILASITALLWSTYIDAFLGTLFMTIVLSLVSGFVCYIINAQLIKQYYE